MRRYRSQGEPHAGLSDSHDRICAGKVEGSARTVAALVWRYSQLGRRNRELAETRGRFPFSVPQVHSTSLTEQEIQIVLLADAVANSCTYAVAFHTALALKEGVGSEETEAIRERRTASNQRFAALSTLANALIEKRGHLSEQELDSFISAGFTKEQVLEVITVVAASTITNYAGNVANPTLEDRFQEYAWRG